MRILRSITVITLSTLTFIYTGSGHAQQNQTKEQAFFESLQDVPLMHGLEELPEQTLSFDKPEGRIIEAYALTHDLTKEDILTYYIGILPQFGWGHVENGTFFRKDEFMDISVINSNNTPVMKILIRPTR